MRSRMRAVRIAGIAVVAIGGLGCFHTRRDLTDLSTPVLVWSQGNGLCSRIVAVDAGRTVWVNQGCETPVDFDEVRTITAAQLDDLWMKFDALPFDQSVADCGARMMHGFQRYAPPASTMGAAACGGTMYDDLTGMPDAFLPLAEALEALE